jgi:thioredoxin reductase
MEKTVIEHDYLVLGGGPAGLQTGYFLGRKGRDYAILEAGAAPGSFFRVFPRHRRLISINKVYTGASDVEANLRFDWNSLLSDAGSELLFKQYSLDYFPAPESLLQYLAEYAQRFSLALRTETTVVRVARNGRGFEVEDQRGGRYRCRRLIVATGLTRPYVPPIPGIEKTENYFDFNPDPAGFRDQRVLIIGKGNSAFETAEGINPEAALIHLCSPHSVTMAWQSHFVGHLRALNANFIDTYQLKAKNAILDADVSRIAPAAGGGFEVEVRFAHAKGQVRTFFYDRVITCTGFRFDASMFDDSCRPELALDDRLPAQTAEWESTNVSDLYFAGTVTQIRDYKRTMSGFIHGFRYNIAALCRILDCKHHGGQWQPERLPAVPERLAEEVLKRVSTSSSMFLQPGFFCDLLVVPEGGDEVHYYRDLPVDYVHASRFGQHGHYYTISLEYGHFDGDPLRVERDPSGEQAHRAFYLHPIIRRYDGPTLQSEHHLQDDVESEWRRDSFGAAAGGFFREQLAGAGAPTVC